LKKIKQQKQSNRGKKIIIIRDGTYNVMKKKKMSTKPW
jgi:hypothetical protein